MPATFARRSTLLLLLALALPAPAALAARDAGLNGTLGATLAGEYALAAGRLDEASDWYLRAAKASGDDAGLAERATRIALLANQDRRAADALALWRARAPNSLAMRGAEATLALRRGDARTAQRTLEALVSAPDPDGWRHAVGALGNGGKDRKLAARLVEGLVERDKVPNDLQAWLAFGGVAQLLQQPALAERISTEAIARFPQEPLVALLRASQLREAGKTAQARAALDALDPARLSGDAQRLALAGEYDELGDSLAAAAVLATGPQSDRSYGLRASLLVKAKDDAALDKLYAELERESAQPDPSRRLLLGQIAEYLKRYPQALEWYRSVPGGPQRWVARLRATDVLRELGRGAEAYAELRTIQSDASADDATRRDAYLLEAELHAKDSPVSPEELDAYARGLAAFPDDGGLLYSRALSWERRDDIRRAEADLRKILVAEPENIAALNALGYTLADRTTRYQEALELIDRARVAEPDNAAIIDSYGWVLYRLGRNDDALVQLRKAYALQKDPEIAAHIAEVLWFAGQRDEARKLFDEARKLDPDNRSLKRALEKTGA